jgi:tetratricopeptide (TPR) repeat protein
MLLNTTCLESQLLKDSASLYLVKKNVDYIYNLRFREARELYTKISAIYPEHPVNFLIRGMMTYWENYPLLNTSPAKTSFESDLHECIRLAEKNNNPDHKAEFLLSDLIARGFLLLFYSDNDLVMEVIPLTSGTYKYVMASFELTSVCADLYYFTGMYNYYRDAYPKIYPMYKPLAMLFPAGDLQTGLNQLNKAAINSVFLRAESLFLLAYINLNFESNYPQALNYYRALHELYPDNPQFLSSYLKNLLLLKRYDEAEKIIESKAAVSSNTYVQSQVLIFKGILKEKKYFDNKAAQQFYHQGISEISLFGDYGHEYEAFGYFGLSRISEVNNEKHNSQMYRKEALKLSDFKKVNFDK